MGATTIWERWDSMLPDGSVNEGEMTSFNHYALGAVCDWLVGVVAGLRPASPGYERVRVAPMPGVGLDWARASLDTRHGRVECGWARQGSEIRVHLSVPSHVEAEVSLPGHDQILVTGGKHQFSYLERPVTPEDLVAVE
jgi:alpha-L-rhamnosidase